MGNRHSLLALICVLAAGAVFAGDRTTLPLDISSAQTFEQQSATIRADLRTSGHYAFLSEGDRLKVNRGLDEMAALFQRHGSIAAMNDEQRVRLFNIQEAVDRLLSRDDKNLWRCERAPLTGSHVRRTLCRMYDEY